MNHELIKHINKFQNHKYRFNDFYYFSCEINVSYRYKHYSFAIFSDVITDKYIHFNNTNQKIKYTDIFNKKTELKSFMFNFVIEPEKKSIDINSTLFQSGQDTYIKILYNNQGIIFKFGDMYKIRPIYINEIITPTPETLLNKNM